MSVGLIESISYLNTSQPKQLLMVCDSVYKRILAHNELDSYSHVKT
jgi:hypothetical protein